MSNQVKTSVQYFGYGSNSDKDMMVHMVGREDLKGEPGQLIGYQLCVQTLDQIRNIIPQNSPLKKSPQEIIRENYGNSFDLFIAVPKPDAVIYGTIWDLTPEEIDLVKEWELVEYGMQEEIQAMALTLEGELIQVETQAVISPPAEYNRTIEGNNYPRYIANKNLMLQAADKSRTNYLKFLKERSSQIK